MMNRNRWLGGGAIGAAAGGALTLAIQVVGHYEGTRNTAYTDPVGIPTICTGHTGPDVELGQTLSDAECQRLLAGDLGQAFDALQREVSPGVLDAMPPTRRAALGSFIFNVGEGAFARSTLLERLNAGKVRAACNELSRWIYANGRKLAGLVKRRAAERELCLVGVGSWDRS